MANVSFCSTKISPNLDFLYTIHRENIPPPENAREIIESGEISLHVLWKDDATSEIVTKWKNRGVDFVELPMSGTANPAGYSIAIVPWNLLDSFIAEREFEYIDTPWRPRIIETLDISAPMCGADECWFDNSGASDLTGAGIRIANFDTGIDVFHPDFFFSDGGAYCFIDFDGNGEFTPGIDGVDLNRNGSLDWGEELSFIDARTLDWSGVMGGVDGVGNQDNIFQPDWDWLYLDENGNSSRDFGPSEGFTESDPGFGEPIFILAASAGENLEDGDTLLMLGTSKILATRDSLSTYRRYINLIYSPPDYGTHGTGVSSIIAGGHAGSRKFTGIAPDSELLACYRYQVDLLECMDWSASEGAYVMLWEMGGYVWEYLDGSSPVEESINSYAELGICQVTPSGNLANCGKHCEFSLDPGESLDLSFSFPESTGIDNIFMTFIWTDIPESGLDFVLHQPGGFTDALPVDTTGSGLLACGGWSYSGAFTSPRDTRAFFLNMWDLPDISDFSIQITNNTGDVSQIHGFCADNKTGWGGGVNFDSHVSHDNTVTWPATSDSGIGVASYSSRGFVGYGGGDSTSYVGMISSFSGKGARISDGFPLLDLAAPGNYDVWASNSSTHDIANFAGYQQFGGTSAAGPHVAGAAAIIFQRYPTWGHADVVEFLTRNTRQDSITGFTYNHTWGFGRLDLSYLADTTNIHESVGDILPNRLSLRAYPNPFNSVVRIIADRPVGSLFIYDATGRLVDRISGETERRIFIWNSGQSPAGIYFIKSPSLNATGRIVLIK